MQNYLKKFKLVSVGLLVILVGLLISLVFYYTQRSNYNTPSSSTSNDESSGAYATPPMTLFAENTTHLTIPEGWSMDVFAKDLINPRVMITDPSGVILTSITSKGTVVALPDTNGDGKADTSIIVAKGLNRPHGIAFVCNPDCLLYIAESQRVGEYAYDSVNKKATYVRTVATLPNGGRHFTRMLLPLPSTYVTHLLVSVGSSCDACEETDPHRASILDIDLTSITPKTTPFVQGLRNSVFMTIQPNTDQVWATDMGRDFLGNDLPPDEVNKIEAGNNYGWPYCYGNNIRDPRVGFASIECDEQTYTPPLIEVPAHSAPLGLSFVPQDTLKEGWPQEYWNNLFVAYHGSWNRDLPTGYKIVRYKQNQDGTLGNAEDFITGFVDKDGTVSGRPAGILIQPGGLMYITDDTAGVIYRLSFQPPKQEGGVKVPDPKIEIPTAGQSVKSPLVVKGSAPGNWYFEASFPIELKDESGKSLFKVPVQAIGEWMTTEYVPFEMSIPFTVTTKQKGTLILHKDNPSGLPEYDQSVEIPIVLEP